MSTVKQTAKTTITLIVLFACLYSLALLCRAFPNEVFYNVQERILSKGRLGSFKAAIMNVSFWTLFVVGAECAVICDLSAFRVFRAFVIPISVLITALFLAAIPAINFYWYWICCFVLEMTGITASIVKLYTLDMSRTSRHMPFFIKKDRIQKPSGHVIDFYIGYGSRLFLLVLLTALVVGFIVFIVQNRNHIF